MASGTLTLSTQSVDYGGGRGGTSMTNTINWSTNGNTLTLSNGGRSGGNYWTLYNATGASDYLVVLKVQVNYGSGWTTISEQSAYIGTVAQGGLRIDTKSEEFLNNLGSYTLTGNCSLRALYYATYAPVPTSDYPYAFPDESYSEASQTPVVVDVVVAPDTPTIANVSATYNSITCDWGTTSFGIPSTGTVYLYCTTRGSTPSTLVSSYIASKTTTGTSTSTITQSTTGTSSTKTNLVANSLYYLYARAYNGSADAWNIGRTTVTSVEPVTVSIGTVTADSIEIIYSTVADGGYAKKDIQYLINGRWYSGATLTGGSAQSGSFVITGLDPLTQYTIGTQVVLTYGSTTYHEVSGATLTVTTLSSAPLIYAPLDILFESINEFSIQKSMTDIDNSVDDVNLSILNNALKNNTSFINKIKSGLKLTKILVSISTVSGRLRCSPTVYYSNNSNTSLGNFIEDSLSALGTTVYNALGITLVSSYSTLLASSNIMADDVTYNLGAKKLIKVYAPVETPSYDTELNELADNGMAQYIDLANSDMNKLAKYLLSKGASLGTNITLEIN